MEINSKMYSIKSTILLLSLLILLLIKSIKSAICPQREAILPCKCVNYFNLIECSDIKNDEELHKIFKIIKYEIDKQQSRLIYDELKLVQTNLVNLGAEIDNIFSDISFRRITISRNSQLKRIEQNTFKSSHNITTEIMIEDNELLGRNHDDNLELFKSLNQFKILNTLHLTDNGVKFIPKYAFNQTQQALRELFLTDNRIEYIDDYAFTGLNSLQLINLDGNFINKLSLHSFDIKNTTKNILRIFLRSNKIQTDSFPPGIFIYLERRSYLNLNINNISTISQMVFQNFFEHRSKLSLSKNPLKCDCDFKWLIDYNIANFNNKNYYNKNNDDDYLLTDYQCTKNNGNDIEQDYEIIDRLKNCEKSPQIEQMEQCLNQTDDQMEQYACLNVDNFAYKTAINSFNLFLLLSSLLLLPQLIYSMSITLIVIH